MKDFLNFEVRRRELIGFVAPVHGGELIEWDFINDVSQMPRNDAG
jgi:hypothetical protein